LLFTRSIRNRERPRLDFVFCQARLAFASVVAYSRFNSTLLPLQGAESIGAYAWRFDDGSSLFIELPRRLILGNSRPQMRSLHVMLGGSIGWAMVVP
jgi:hypothetical protein